ncbi:MAG: hypothetical protein M0Q42_01340 [Xanthomonadales bacterium]|nr:hypothetical protein [Xanthomonadales bacterium]
MRLFNHLYNEISRNVLLLRRYWFEAVLSLGLVLVLFGGLIFTVLSVGGGTLESGSVDGIIVGFAVWLFATTAMGGAMGDVAEETEQRTLEQICLAPLPLGTLLAVRALLQLGGGLLMLVVTLMVIEVVTGGRLEIPYIPTLAAALLAAPSLLGVGFALAGVLLLSKKGTGIQVAAFPLVLGLMALPAYPMNALALLPFAFGAAAARASAAGTALGPEVFAVIALNSACYLALGVLIYRRLEQHARKLGVLGHF